MRMRPKVVKGDLVKFSKKGKAQKGEFKFRNKSMVVLEVLGDGIEGYSNLYVDYMGHSFYVYRYQVWKTGFNAFESMSPDELCLDENAPVNNNGLKSCYMCHMKTKTLDSFTSIFDICDNPNCKWYKN